MIPYDDLVAALSSWRARQGLPVNTIGGSGSGPTAKAGSGPTKAPPRAASQVEEVSADMLDDGAYEPEGYEANDAEATSIGSAPERPTEADLGNRDDW
jgi:hypothetical protein